MNSSDSSTSIESLKELVRLFCDERQWDPYHGPKDLAIGLVTEGSELLELFRFLDEVKCRALVQDPARRPHVADELADSLYFILRFAQLYNFDLSQALHAKVRKNALKYPVQK